MWHKVSAASRKTQDTEENQVMLYWHTANAQCRMHHTKKNCVTGQVNAVNRYEILQQLSSLERLPSPIHKLLNVDREVNVITDSVPAQLLMLPYQVVSHVAQQQHAPLMETPLGDFSTESFVARFCITAQHSHQLLAHTAVTVASCLELRWVSCAGSRYKCPFLLTVSG